MNAPFAPVVTVTPGADLAVSTASAAPVDVMTSWSRQARLYAVFSV